MSVGRWARLVATIAMVAAVVTMVHGSEAPKFGFDALGLRKASPVVDPFLIDLQERTFRFFWDTANPKNGLVPDRYPTPSFSSVAAVGFALTAYPVGVERGYVTRKAARQRVLATLRFFNNAPQSPHTRGVAGYKGFFYHFLDMKTGERFADSELSTVDTAILLAGALFCQSYFDGSDAGGSRNPLAGRQDLPPRRLDVGAAEGAGDQSRLVARRRLPRIRLARLQRGDAGLPAGARLADAPGRTRGLGGMDQHLRPVLGQAVRTGIPGLRPAVRPPVHACLAGLPRCPGRLHAAARPRLLPEHAPGDLRATGVRGRQSAAMQGLWRDDLGTDGERRAGGHGARGRRSHAAVSQLRGARNRRRGRGHPRRLHAGADGGGGLAAVRAGTCDPRRARNEQALR